MNGLIRFRYSMLLAGMVSFAPAVFSGQEPAAQNKSASVLESGMAIEAAIAGGDAHDYKVSLKTGQFLHLVVDQRGVDVVVRLIGQTASGSPRSTAPTATAGRNPFKWSRQPPGTTWWRFARSTSPPVVADTR